MAIAVLFTALSSASQQTGTFTDPRDGKTYKTVQIGTQTWMAENLAYKAIGGCWAFFDDQSNVAKYGYLYNWNTTDDACPPNWHLPSDAEWTMLIDSLGGELVAGRSMKSNSGWVLDNNGTNTSGFNGLPAGIRNVNGMYGNLGNATIWWSSTQDKPYSVWVRTLYHYSGFAIVRHSQDRGNGFSVRCVRD
jgi:uncharacterized protein (TIGR02145 family)